MADIFDEFPHILVPVTFSNNEPYNYLIREKQQYNFEKLTAIIENELLLLNGDTIQLPQEIVLPTQDINALIRFIYPDFSADSDPQYLVEHAILAPKNEHINAINAAIMNQFPVDAVDYFSADIIESQTDSEHQYPI
ncbi:10050_t:CDS:2, partial [Racocetra persica]